MADNLFILRIRLTFIAMPMALVKHNILFGLFSVQSVMPLLAVLPKVNKSLKLLYTKRLQSQTAFLEQRRQFF